MKLYLYICMLVIFASSGAYALEVSFYAGDVSIIRNNAPVKGINSGTKIEGNDIIVTGKKSMINLVYKDGSEIRVSENTRLKIGQMEANSDSAPVVVLSGNVSTTFSKLSKDDKIRKVYTPTTVCAVRGTQFNIAVSEGADSRVDLTEGSLDVHNPYGAQQLEQGQNIQAGVAQAPKAADTSSLSDWKAAQDKKVTEDPQGKGDQFSTYMDDFSVRSSKASKGIDKLDKDFSNNDQKKMKKKGAEIDKVAGQLEDDFYLGAAATDSIAAITDRFKNDKNEMYDKFLKLKEESNKVREQQQRNYEAIQAVKAAYKKAYDEIMAKYKSDTDSIKGGTDKNKVKPTIEKKSSKDMMNSNQQTPPAN